MYFSSVVLFLLSFFFNDTATTEIYTLSLHDALPISLNELYRSFRVGDTLTLANERLTAERLGGGEAGAQWTGAGGRLRSEEHTSELQSQFHLVCRLLLEKKKQQPKNEIRREVKKTRV